MASTYFQNPSSGASSTTERRTLTISFWVKRSKLGATQYMFSGYNNASYYNGIIFNSGDNLRVFEMAGATTNFSVKTTRKFRDTNAWSHIVVAFDTTQATASDRIKIYVNGVQETAFDTTTYPSQNHNTYFGMTSGGDGYPTYIGGNPSGSYFDGLMADVYLVGGTALTPSTFGETDSDTGEWKPNTSPTITYGSTAGVNSHLNFENASNLGEDTSGNNNDFTVATGTAIQTLDCPSNVFCVLNNLKKLTGTLSNGNTTWTASGDNGIWGTIGANSGKWYWETKMNNSASLVQGIASEDVTQTTDRVSNTGVYGIQDGTTYGYYANNGSRGQSTGFPNPSSSNTICHALDLDNGKYWVGVNGSYYQTDGTTGNPSTDTNPTYTGIDTTKFWFPFLECRGAGASGSANFGNGYMGTTAISSEGTNASGNGKFEYDVPTGYTALSTKGLNE